MPPLLDLVDDKDIPNDAVVLRRVNWNQGGGIDKYSPGQTFNITANCFRDQTMEGAVRAGLARPCMSVGVDYILHQHGLAVARMVEDFEGFGLVSFDVGSLRNLTTLSGVRVPQGVMLCPTETEPWHAVVFDLTGSKRGNPACQAIANLAAWEVALVKPG
jgi:hypothetical protein